MAIRNNMVLVNDGGSSSKTKTKAQNTTLTKNTAPAVTTKTTTSPATKVATRTVSVTPAQPKVVQQPAVQQPAVQSPTVQQTLPNRANTITPSVSVQTPQQQAQAIIKNRQQTLEQAKRAQIKQDYAERLSPWSNESEQKWNEARTEARVAKRAEDVQNKYGYTDKERDAKVDAAVTKYQDINQYRDINSPNAKAQVASNDPTKGTFSSIYDYAVGGAKKGTSNIKRWAQSLPSAFESAAIKDEAMQNARKEAIAGRNYDFTADQEKLNKLNQEIREKAKDWGIKSFDEDANRRFSEYQVKKGSAAETAGEAAQSIGNMVPSIVSNLVVPGSGMAALFMSAAGSKMEEAMSQGYDFDQAFTAGVLSGAIEVATEQLFGGIPAMGKGSLDAVIDGTINEIANDAVSRALLKYTTNSIGEGTEELLSEYANAYARLLWDYDFNIGDIDFNEVTEDALHSFASGFLVGAVMDIGGFVPSGMYSQDVNAFADFLVDEGILEEDAVRNRDGSVKNEILNLYDAGIGNTNFAQAGRALQEGTARPVMQDMFTGIKQNAETRKARQAQITENNNAIVNDMQGEDKQRANRVLKVADSLHTNVVLDPTVNGNGYFDPVTGEIHVNPYSENAVKDVFVHEMTHRMEGTKSYNKFKDFVESDFDEATARNNIPETLDTYRQRLGRDYSPNEIDSEVVANYAQTFLFDDPVAIEKFAAISKSEARRIWEALKSAVKGEDPAIRQAEYLYARALGESNRRADAGYYDSLALQFNPAYSRGVSELRSEQNGNILNINGRGQGNGGVLQENGRENFEDERYDGNDERVRQALPQNEPVLEANIQRINDVLTETTDKLNKAKAPKLPLRLTDASSFAEALAEQLSEANKYRDYLSPHDANYFEDNGSITLLNEDGNAGIAVRPSDGYISSVFNASSTRGALENLLVTALSMGGKCLDCTGKELVAMYSQYGFVPVAKLHFNGDFYDNWNYEEFGEPDVFFMVHNGDSVDEVLKNKKNYPVPDVDTVPYVPKDDWDVGEAYMFSLARGEEALPQYSLADTELDNADFAAYAEEQPNWARRYIDTLKGSTNGYEEGNVEGRSSAGNGQSDSGHVQGSRWALEAGQAYRTAAGNTDALIHPGDTGWDFFYDQIRDTNPAYLNKDGTPLIVYRGSGTLYDRYNMQLPKSGDFTWRAVFSTADPEVALSYARGKANELGGDFYLYPMAINSAFAPVEVDCSLLDNSLEVQQALIDAVNGLRFYIDMGWEATDDYFQEVLDVARADMEEQGIRYLPAIWDAIQSAFLNNGYANVIKLNNVEFDQYTGKPNTQYLILDEESVVPASKELWANPESIEAYYNYDEDAAAQDFYDRMGGRLSEQLDEKRNDDFDFSMFDSDSGYEYSKEGTGIEDVTDEMSTAVFAPTFYSKLQREVENFKGDKIGASSIVSYLKGRGVKDDEIKWSGINTFLDGKKSVGKQELLDYLTANSLQIEQETLSDKTQANNGKEYYDDETGEIINVPNDIEGTVEDFFRNYYLNDLLYYGNIDDVDTDSVVAFANGDTLNIEIYGRHVYDDPNDSKQLLYIYKPNYAAPRWSDYKLDGGSNYREYKYKLPGSDYTNRSMQVHWGDSGVLAHARVQDFTNSNNDAVLFVDEIQSDWHNQGAELGYITGNNYAEYVENERQEVVKELNNNKSLIALTNELVNKGIAKDVEAAQDYLYRVNPFEHYDAKIMNIITAEGWDLIAEDYLNWVNKVEKYKTDEGHLSWGNEDKIGVPDAPFRKNYTDFVLKSLLREAAENGYDYLAWTTGKMQEERWSSRYAEGYRIEYDQDIPKFLNKYGKQWGARVGSVKIGNSVDTQNMSLEELTEMLKEGPGIEYITDSNEVDYAKQYAIEVNENRLRYIADRVLEVMDSFDDGLDGSGLREWILPLFAEDMTSDEYDDEVYKLYNLFYDMSQGNIPSSDVLDYWGDENSTMAKVRYIVDAVREHLLYSEAIDTDSNINRDMRRFKRILRVYQNLTENDIIAVENLTDYYTGQLDYDSVSDISSAWATRAKLEESVEEFYAGTSYDVPAIPITPEMRQSVLYEGQPMFSKSGTGIGEQSGKEKVSKVASNTYTNTDFFNDVYKAAMQLDAEPNPYAYDPISNRQTVYNAVNRVNSNIYNEMQRLSNAEGFTAEDLVTSMFITRQLFDAGYTSEALRWSKMVQEKGTQGGQLIQAFSIFTNTPEGFIVKGENLIGKYLDEWAENHPREVEKIKQVADHLTNWFPSFTADISTKEGFKIVADYVRGIAEANGMKMDDAEVSWIVEQLANRRTSEEVAKAFERLQADLGTDLTGEEVDEIFEYINEAKKYPATSKEAAELQAKAAAVVARHLNSSFEDKWNAWRYLAMLGNTRTHLRNMLGNAMFGTVVGIKNAIAGQLEAATGLFSDVDRTKTANVAYRATKTGKALFDAALKDANDIYTLLDGQSKYNIMDDIEGQKRIFKLAPLESFRKFNGDALEAEDWFALKRDYARFLSNYMYANNLAPSILSEQGNAQADRARAYAIEEAQKATFRNYNAFASKLSEFSKGLATSDNLAARGIGTMVEGLVPFKNTPANVLARGIEYSPIGLADAMAKGIKMVANGTVSADEFIDSFSSGLTGTGIMLLGYMLAEMGLVTGGDDDDDKLQTLKDAEGWQAYSLHIGDKYYSIDWMAPAAIPLFVGANLEQLGEANGLDFNDFITAITQTAEPITEMTMLQGVNNLLDSIKYGENGLTDVAMTTATNYLTQGIPTALGQVARAVDETRRTSASTNAGTLGDLEYTWRKVKNKIPGLSKSNEPYLDIWGREQQNTGGSVAGRLAFNMLSPGYYSEDSTSGVDMFVEDLYEATGDAKYLPSKAARSLKIDGEKRRLTAEEYTTYAKIKGGLSYDLINAFLEQGTRLSAEECGDAVEVAYQIANAYAKQEVGADLTKKEEWYIDCIEAGADPLQLMTMGDLTSDRYFNIQNTQRDQYLADLQAGHSTEQVEYVMEAGYGKKQRPVVYQLLDMGATPEQLESMDANGNGSWTQDEIYHSALSEDEKRLVWEMMGYKTTYDSYKKKNK